MTTLKERYVLDEKGNRIAVLLDLEDYRRLLEELEELESIRAYDAAKDSGDEVLPLRKGERSEGVLTYLKSFNRKERFYLIAAITGNRELTLSAEFACKLGETLNVTIPNHAFTAMDYHIDWIGASLMMCFRCDEYPNGVYPRNVDDERVITAHQEDVDLLISYYEGSVCHIIMLEVKGASPWSNS